VQYKGRTAIYAKEYDLVIEIPNTIMLRLDCGENSAKVWVLSKIRKTGRKFYFCKKEV